MNKNKGIITTYVLVFGAVFLVLLAGLLGFILLQLRQSNQKIAWNESLHIAEAGLNYYHWCLNNEVGDNCLTEKEYYDPTGNLMGAFSLEIEESVNCGEIAQRTIIASGWTSRYSDIKREIRAVYARESVAKYAYLLNDNVWAGSDREIRGPYHSNGGVRMDGENQSLVTSAKEDWICTASFGCSSCPTADGCWIEGSNCVCPGVFTTTDNADTDLFDFPVSSFDFDGITIDLAVVKELTLPFPQQYYWPPVSQLDPEGKGYHLRFLNNGTFEIWIITDLQASWACHSPCDSGDDYYNDYFIILAEYQYGDTIAINPDCSLIFIEDNLWIEGEVRGKVTVAAADLQSPTKDVDVVLPGEINYTVLDGSDGLAVVGERDVLISPASPDQMELRGIFIAQKGHFGRNMYWSNIREQLEIYGSIISNGRVGTKWTSGGHVVSGYLKRENYFDANLVYDPPYFVPYTSPDFKIVNWEEIE